jgi:hypothetical protein
MPADATISGNTVDYTIAALNGQYRAYHQQAEQRQAKMYLHNSKPFPCHIFPNKPQEFNWSFYSSRMADLLEIQSLRTNIFHK